MKVSSVELVAFLFTLAVMAGGFALGFAIPLRFPVRVPGFRLGMLVTIPITYFCAMIGGEIGGAIGGERFGLGVAGFDFGLFLGIVVSVCLCTYIFGMVGGLLARLFRHEAQ